MKDVWILISENMTLYEVISCIGIFFAVIESIFNIIKVLISLKNKKDVKREEIAKEKKRPVEDSPDENKKNTADSTLRTEPPAAA